MRSGGIHVVAAEPHITSAALAERVAAEYRGKRQARRAIVEGNLVGMHTLGIADATPKALDEGGSLTPYGTRRLRFLPRRYWS